MVKKWVRLAATLLTLARELAIGDTDGSKDDVADGEEIVKGGVRTVGLALTSMTLMPLVEMIDGSMDCAVALELDEKASGVDETTEDGVVVPSDEDSSGVVVPSDEDSSGDGVTVASVEDSTGGVVRAGRADSDVSDAVA